MALEKQIQIYSVDTGSFYSDDENELHWLNQGLCSQKNELVEESKAIESCFEKVGVSKDDIIGWSNDGLDDELELKDKSERYAEIKEQIQIKNKEIKESKNKLLDVLSDKVEANIESNGAHHIRELRDDAVTDKNIISVFDSYFTRTIGAKQDELCEDFMVVQVYYFDVIKDLIHFGFMYKGEKYVYFTSSAGQIRTKKTVFVKESVWEKYKSTIMCGLTIEDINAKGGNNPNKHLAYLALANSATDVWDEFDIDKTIVIDDFETEVDGEYDLVDDVDYSITRTFGKVPITHTDGAGMMLPCMGKNRMIRLPWVKGLLGVFDFKKFIEEKNCPSIVKDIYGKEHDVIAEDIQIIFTKSQFKMWKYYDSWDDYKRKYKEHGCTAGITNVEEDRIKNATINYQMLQSLTDITEDEIKDMVKMSADKLNNLWSSGKGKKTSKEKIRAIENLKATFGATPYNMNKTPFQKAIDLYPDLMNDEYVKSQLREIKNAMRKKYRAGKLNVRGKYTFILPDFYAACEHWFMGISEPIGLLGKNEVYCKLFSKYDKLDCLRSPHLYMEHAVRDNAAYRGIEIYDKWFDTSAVYTSCHDLISKILQFDVDGDKSLVVADKTLIKVAERNLKKFDIVPLYYNMRKAEPVHLDNAEIYKGLNAAFTGGNIGIYSNNISKIWNSYVFSVDEDTIMKWQLGKDDKELLFEELKKNDIFTMDKDDFMNWEPEENKRKQILEVIKENQLHAIKVIKWLCMENNFVIDYAKTLYKPKRPKDKKKMIVELTKSPLPHFFKYAKDKNDNQVVKANDSFVNKLDGKFKDLDDNGNKEYIIPNHYLNFRNIGLDDIKHELLMKNPDIECKVLFDENGKMVKEKTDPLIVAYCELNQQHRFALDNAMRIDKTFSTDTIRKSQLKYDIKYKNAINDIKNELSKYEYSDEEITDILVKYLYEIKKSKHKTALWFCYGDIIYANLKENVKPKTQERQCIDCGEWFEVGMKNTKTRRCHECQTEKDKEVVSIKNAKYYASNKN